MLYGFPSHPIHPSDYSNGIQTVEGYVAEKGDFKGEKPETEEAKKKTLTGADVVIIPAGVPRTYFKQRSEIWC